MFGKIHKIFAKKPNTIQFNVVDDTRTRIEKCLIASGIKDTNSFGLVDRFLDNWSKYEYLDNHNVIDGQEGVNKDEN